MKLQALASVAVLLCTGFVSAMPNQQWGDNCYKCEYKYDDCGNEYGGSYNSCYESFDQCYPKPYCKKDECHKCEYKNDNCGKKYGGSYNSCENKFDFYWKKPHCKKEDEWGYGWGEGDD